MACSTQLNEKLLDIPIIPLETGMTASSSSSGNALSQRTQSTATENTDASSYKKRSPSTLSATETKHLEDMDRDQCLQHLKGLSTVFAGPLVQQKIWPLYFEIKEAAGKAMQNGYKGLWSTFIIAETLLAAVAIQPLITNVPTVWLAIKSIWRTLGISSAVRLHWVGNHYHFSSLFAWQTEQSYLGLGVQYWAIDWHPGDSASVRHNMEHHCHKLQFVGDLWDSSGNNLCSCCSFGCCCWCDHL
jgi:hypothetical protein